MSPAEKVGRVVGVIVSAFLVAIVLLLAIAVLRYAWGVAFG